MVSLGWYQLYKMVSLRWYYFFIKTVSLRRYYLCKVVSLTWYNSLYVRYQLRDTVRHGYAMRQFLCFGAGRPARGCVQPIPCCCAGLSVWRTVILTQFFIQSSVQLYHLYDTVPMYSYRILSVPSLFWCSYMRTSGAFYWYLRTIEIMW